MHQNGVSLPPERPRTPSPFKMHSSDEPSEEADDDPYASGSILQNHAGSSSHFPFPDLPNGQHHDSIRSDAATPNDPFLGAADDLPPRRPHITRKLLELVEKHFPVNRDRDLNFVTAGSDPDLTGTLQDQERGYQNPLLFLAEAARRGWNAKGKAKEKVTLPPSVLPLPVDDAELFDNWQSKELKRVIKDQQRFFHHGIHGSKRDLAPDLDAVQRGILSEAIVPTLFAS